MVQATDTGLVRRTLAGDKDAFGDLVCRYQGLVYGLAYHRVGNFADAEDVAQDVFVKAFRTLHQLEQPGRFAAWLKTITANECSTWNRRHQLVMSLEEVEIMPSYAALAEEKSRQREKRTEVLQAVDSLPEKSRLVVTLHYLSGLSCAEIGEHLDMSANAVAQHLNRARKQLKEMLMAEIKEDYVTNRLSENFVEEVLERVSMHPILEGEFIVSKGEGDARGLMIGTGESGGCKSLMTLWMRQDDLDAVIGGLTAGRSAETAKGRALDSAVQVLSASGIEIVRVVLRSSAAWRCRADMELKQGSADITLDLRPSDAIGLAVRAKAPIYAEEPVIRDGNVGEDDVPVPEEHMDSKAYAAELGSQHQVDALRDSAFEMGLSPEEMVDTIRCHVDEAEGVIRLWIETFPDREWILSLEEHRSGVQKLFELAQARDNSGIIRAGKPYKVSYSILGQDARMRIVPDTADPRVEWGLLGAQ